MRYLRVGATLDSETGCLEIGYRMGSKKVRVGLDIKDLLESDMIYTHQGMDLTSNPHRKEVLCSLIPLAAIAELFSNIQLSVASRVSERMPSRDVDLLIGAIQSEIVRRLTASINGTGLTRYGVRVRGEREIDASIEPFIRRINEAGFPTHQSHSGIWADHPLMEMLGNDPIPGYVVFPPSPLNSRIYKIARSLGLQCRYRRSYRIPRCLWVFMGDNERATLGNWEKFTKALEGARDG